MSRMGIFAYGILSYLVFFAVFLYGIGFIGGFFTPTRLHGVRDAGILFFQQIAFNSARPHTALPP